MCFYIKYETINVSHKIAPILIFDGENYNFDIRFFLAWKCGNIRRVNIMLGLI